MSTREPSSYTPAELSDPTIDAATLALLAQHRPDLHPLIQRHPNCYPELITWIAAQEPPAPTAPAAPTQTAAAQPSASRPAAAPLPTADEWAARFQATHGREPSMSEYQAALAGGQIAVQRDASMQQISEGAKQIATGAKDFFNTHIAPAAAGAARTVQQTAAEARTSPTGWRAWLPFALPALGVLGFIAAFLPAVTARAFGTSVSVSFVQSDDATGTLLIISMLIVIGLSVTALLTRKKWATLAAGIAGISLGAIWLLTVIVGFANLASSGSMFGVRAAPGFGLILLLIVSIGLLAASVLLLIGRRGGQPAPAAGSAPSVQQYPGQPYPGQQYPPTS